MLVLSVHLKVAALDAVHFKLGVVVRVLVVGLLRVRSIYFNELQLLAFFDVAGID